MNVYTPGTSCSLAVLVEGFADRAVLFPVQQTRYYARYPRAIANSIRWAHKAHFLCLQALPPIAARLRYPMACFLLFLMP